MGSREEYGARGLFPISVSRAYALVVHYVLRAGASSILLVMAAGCATGGSSGGTSAGASAGPLPAAEDAAVAIAPTPSIAVTTAPSDAAPLASSAPAATQDAPSEDASCSGSDIDLAIALQEKRCRAGRDAPPTPASASKDLKLTLTPSATAVAPGGHVDLVLEIVNTSSAPIPLYFSGDLALGAEVRSATARITPPPGNAPKNADPHCATVDCRLRSSHVVIAPNGKAHARIGWDAVKTAWPKSGPTTCCTVHVDPVAQGPLANGTYHVKVPLPYESNQGNPVDPEIAIRVGK